MERLKLFRKSLGLSQKSMAGTIGITLSMYEKVESGRAGVSAAFMRRLKKAFPDVDINFMFFDGT